MWLEKGCKMKKLKKLREQCGYSYSKIADKLKISKAYYWQIENKKRNLSYLMALKIAKVFNLKPDDLFYYEID